MAVACRLRSSQPSSAGTDTSPTPRTRCRRHWWLRRRDGLPTACPTIRGRGSCGWRAGGWRTASAARKRGGDVRTWLRRGRCTRPRTGRAPTTPSSCCSCAVTPLSRPVPASRSRCAPSPASPPARSRPPSSCPRPRWRSGSAGPSNVWPTSRSRSPRRRTTSCAGGCPSCCTCSTCSSTRAMPQAAGTSSPAPSCPTRPSDSPARSLPQCPTTPRWRACSRSCCSPTPAARRAPVLTVSSYRSTARTAPAGTAPASPRASR